MQWLRQAVYYFIVSHESATGSISSGDASRISQLSSAFGILSFLLVEVQVID